MRCHCPVSKPVEHGSLNPLFQLEIGRDGLLIGVRAPLDQALVQLAIDGSQLRIMFLDRGALPQS